MRTAELDFVAILTLTSYKRRVLTVSTQTTIKFQCGLLIIIIWCAHNADMLSPSVYPSLYVCLQLNLKVKVWNTSKVFNVFISSVSLNATSIGETFLFCSHNAASSPFVCFPQQRIESFLFFCLISQYQIWSILAIVVCVLK